MSLADTCCVHSPLGCRTADSRKKSWDLKRSILFLDCVGFVIGLECSRNPCGLCGPLARGEGESKRKFVMETMKYDSYVHLRHWHRHCGLWKVDVFFHSFSIWAGLIFSMSPGQWQIFGLDVISKYVFNWENTGAMHERYLCVAVWDI
jgi:hypothetical protein